jgi:hypothetical protein
MSNDSQQPQNGEQDQDSEPSLNAPQDVRPDGLTALDDETDEGRRAPQPVEGEDSKKP